MSNYHIQVSNYPKGLGEGIGPSHAKQEEDQDQEESPPIPTDHDTSRQEYRQDL